jgi:hypothetical protein
MPSNANDELSMGMTTVSATTRAFRVAARMAGGVSTPRSVVRAHPSLPNLFANKYQILKRYTTWIFNKQPNARPTRNARTVGMQASEAGSDLLLDVVRTASYTVIS